MHVKGRRIWRATHPEEAASLDEQQRPQQAQHNEQQGQQHAQHTRGGQLLGLRRSGQTLMHGDIGGMRFVFFYCAVYMALAGNLVVPYVLRDTELVYLYPIVFIVVGIYFKFLAGNTFMYLDLSQNAVSFTLTTDGIFVSRPPTGPCGCCPLPIPGLYVVREALALAAITEVQVYSQQLCVNYVHYANYANYVNSQVYSQQLTGAVSDSGSSGNSGGPSLSYSVDESSIKIVSSPSTHIEGRPTFDDLLCQPCFLTSALAGCGEAGSFTQLFLGAKAGPHGIVRLSKPVFSPRLAAEAFAARDKLRTHLATMAVQP